MSLTSIVNDLAASGATAEQIAEAVTSFCREKEERERGQIPWLVLRRMAIERDGSICRYCGENTEIIHIDHVIPRNQGGTNHLENVVVSCARCNLSKGGRTPEQWEAKNGRHS